MRKLFHIDVGNRQSAFNLNISVFSYGIKYTAKPISMHDK